jgi:hypothetical protein
VKDAIDWFHIAFKILIPDLCLSKALFDNSYSQGQPMSNPSAYVVCMKINYIIKTNQSSTGSRTLG